MVEKLTHGVVFVNDYLIVGHPDSIEDNIKQLKKNGFIVKVEDDLRVYLSCEIRFNSKRTKAWLGQSFGKFGKKERNQDPWNSKFWYVHPINEDEQILFEKQNLYHSGVGMLLYPVKRLCPDIANAVTELSKVLDGANMAAYKEMH
ncbi:hypothetical protein ACHAXS_003453 [Conticribra weissflogii]